MEEQVEGSDTETPQPRLIEIENNVEEKLEEIRESGDEKSSKEEELEEIKNSDSDSDSDSSSSEREAFPETFSYSKKKPDDICIVMLGGETTYYGWLDHEKPNSFPSVVSYQLNQSTRGLLTQNENQWYIGPEAIKQYGILGKSRARYLRPIDNSQHDFLALESSRDAFMGMLRYIFHGLNLNEKDVKRRSMTVFGPSVLIVYSAPINSHIYNSIISEILGNYASKVHFVFSPLCALFKNDPLIDDQLQRSDKTALLIESGTRMTYVFPTYTGYAMEGALISKKFGAYDLLKAFTGNMNVRNNEVFSEFLRKKGTLISDEEMKKEIIEYGFVALDFNEEMEKNGFYFLNDGKGGMWKPKKPSKTSPSNKSEEEIEKGKFNIGIEFFYIPESFFKPQLISEEDDNPSLVEMVIKSLHKSPPSLHKTLVSNIHLTGGNLRYKNLPERLTEELKKSFSKYFPDLIEHIRIFPSVKEDTWNGALRIGRQKDFIQQFLTLSHGEEGIGPSEMCF
eukprot:TRINITY_DN1063_c1_g1_i4.p1 TRINITY_DN1063_c1_g1~~TRINITY_DN1063_c1_g1_i4.p1  ORF type:complete len:509 (-),score=171.63 TRINITY_DN1063_c1_g1_i4:55-1581(-)